VVEDGGTSAELQVDPDDRVTSVKLDQEIVVADLRED
jgi:hypothetical protein